MGSLKTSIICIVVGITSQAIVSGFVFYGGYNFLANFTDDIVALSLEVASISSFIGISTFYWARYSKQKNSLFLATAFMSMIAGFFNLSEGGSFYPTVAKMGFLFFLLFTTFKDFNTMNKSQPVLLFKILLFLLIIAIFLFSQVVMFRYGVYNLADVFAMSRVKLLSLGDLIMTSCFVCYISYISKYISALSKLNKDQNAQ